MPPKRSKKRKGSTSTTSTRTNAKKAKEAASLAEDLICPITLELPVDPVTAEDGQHYERAAIQTHINNHQHDGNELKSPVLNEGMGPKLLPAPRIKNHVETLVKAGLITGDLADKWKAKLEEKEEMEILMEQAEEGDAVAMYNVGVYYDEGRNGFPRNHRLAYEWFKKSHNLGDNNSTASLGDILTEHNCLPESKETGIMYITLSAERGSKYGAFLMGLMLARGIHGISVDNDAAIHWLEKSMNSEEDGMGLSDEVIKQAQELLEELTGDKEPTD